MAADTTVRVSADQIVKELQSLADTLPIKAAQALRLSLSRFLYKRVIDRSPVAVDPKSRHPGKFRAANLISALTPQYAGLPNAESYVVPGVDLADSAVNSSPITSPIFITDDAAERGRNDSYAAVVEGGRQLGSRGIMQGSEQAEDGVYGPSTEDALKAKNEILQYALSLLEK